MVPIKRKTIAQAPSFQPAVMARWWCSDGTVMVLVRLWRYDNTIKLGGDQLLQCIEEG